MIKRILWCFQKFICKNEILWQPACVRLKTPNGLHFDPPWKRHFVHTWCFLFRIPLSSVLLNAFLFDKTLCLVIITYLWSQFRNLTFLFLICYLSFLLLFSHWVPFAFLPESNFDFWAGRFLCNSQGKGNEIEFLCQIFSLFRFRDEDVPKYFCIVIRA